MKKLLIVVDMQNDFIDGSLGSPDAQKVVGPVVREIEGDYDEIILTMDTHGENYLETYEGRHLPVVHCVKGTEGWQINDEVMQAVMSSGKKSTVIEKPVFGSYDLIRHIDEIKDDVESITLVGLCTDICVVSNAMLVRSRYVNTPIYYVEDAMAATSPENQAATIKVMNACQIYAAEGER